MTFSLYGTDVLRVPRAETRMRDCERSRGMIERTNSMVIPLRPGITVLDLRLLVRYLARTLCNLTICKASSTAVLSPGSNVYAHRTDNRNRFHSFDFQTELLESRCLQLGNQPMTSRLGISIRGSLPTWLEGNRNGTARPHPAPQFSQAFDGAIPELNRVDT